MSQRTPLVRTISFVAPATATAASASLVLGEVPFDGVVTAVTYTPNTGIAGANTNTRRVAVLNLGQAGAGTTLVADVQFNAGVNSVSGDELALTLAAAGNRNVVEGDELQFQSNAVGTGIADAGGLVQVEITRG